MTAHALAAAPPFDSDAAEAFAERVGDIVNSGAVALMLAIGHRLDLFTALAQLRSPDSPALADHASVDERYVREWLAAMVTGGIVDYDPATGTYHLPAERAASLTPAGELGNLAVYAQFVAMGGGVMERVLDGFRTGEGTRYEDYPCFHTIMAEDTAQTVLATLFDQVLPLAPGLHERLEAGIDVMDAGCGAGGALIAMARRYPSSRFTGYDLCGDVIASARQAAAGLDNIRFERRDLTGFDEQEAFDFITSFDAIHDQKDPQGLVRGLYGALRPGGVYLVQDIGGSARLENNLDFPMAAFLYSVSCLHCMPVSLGQGGAGLGTMWGWETAEALLRDAGFPSPQRTVFEHDPMGVWFVARKV